MDDNSDFSFNTYQTEAMKTAIYPENKAIVYTCLGLLSEAGEIAGKVKKVIRDKNGVFDDDVTDAISHEIGDVLWYVAALCKALDISMAHVAADNIEKLAGRQMRGTLSGSGDNR